MNTSKIQNIMTKIFNTLFKSISDNIVGRLNEEEQLLYDIVIKILNYPNTVKIYNNFTPTYLINKKMKCYVRINNCIVTIITPKNTISKSCSIKLYDDIQKMVGDSVIEDTTKIDEKIFVNESNILSKIGENEDTGENILV